MNFSPKLICALSGELSDTNVTCGCFFCRLNDLSFEIHKTAFERGKEYGYNEGFIAGFNEGKHEKGTVGY